MSFISNLFVSLRWYRTSVYQVQQAYTRVRARLVRMRFSHASKMMPPRNCESDDVENPNDTRRNELTARETSLLGTRDVSLDNVRGVVVLFVIYFHYY